MPTILHVDADESAQKFIQTTLGKQYNVITATDGPTAIQYCAMIQPDLILIDPAVPGIDSQELTSRLKMFMPQTPIMLIDSPSGINGKSLSPAPDVDSQLTKPVDRQTLLQQVQSLLPQPLPLPGLTSSLSPAEMVKQFELQIAALNQANKRLASLNAISALIGTSLDLDHFTDEILAQIHKIIAFDSATLFLLKGDVLEAAASRGLKGYRRGMNVFTKSDRNSAWRVVTHKLPLIINDVTHSEYWESRPELSRIRSWLGVPLICKDRVVGVLTLDKNEPEGFSEADARYLFTLAYQIAIAVENTQLFEEWEDQATRLKLINEVAQEINTILNVNDLFEALARAIYERLQYDWVAVLEVDDKRSALILKAIYGEQPSSLEVGTYRQPVEAGLMGKAVAAGQAMIAHYTGPNDDKAIWLESSDACAELVMPVFGDNQVVAVISVARKLPDGFSDQDLWTLSSLGSQAATAIENARLYHDLSQRLSDLALLNETGQALTSTIGLAQMLSIVIERVRLALAAESAYVLLMESSDEMLTVVAATGAHAAGVAKAKLSTGFKVIDQVILEGEPCLFKVLTDQPDLFAELDRILGGKIHNALIAPLTTRRIIIGLVLLVNKETGDFSRNDLNLLGALSQLMVGAVENAQLFNQLQAYSDKLELTVIARTQRLQAIRKISQVVSEGLALEELLPVVGQHISQIFTLEVSADEVQVAVGLVEGSNINLEVIYSADQATPARLSQKGGESGRVAPRPAGVVQKIDLQKPIGQVVSQAKTIILAGPEAQQVYELVIPGKAKETDSLMIAPLITGGKTIGLIMVASRVSNIFTDSDLETLESLAFQVASAVEHARLLQKSREIAIVEERTRLARDMHDGVAQNLAYLLIQVDRCLNYVEEGSKLETQLEQIGALLKQNIDELRRNIFDLRPVDLEGKSLFEVLENFVTEFGRRWNLATTCVVDSGPVDMPAEVESSLYRILQETLSNARQHAQCTQLSVRLAVQENRWVTLEVKDNGQGFDINQTGRTPKNRRGLGLVSMRERASSIGGQLTIESIPGQGTRVFAMLPLHPRNGIGS